MPSVSTPVRFGSFELDLQSGELRKNGIKIHIGEQPLQVLALLLESPGHLVTREEIRRRLWAADTFVDFEPSLNAAVKRLREALGDSAENPTFIETLPRRGYRLIVPITSSALTTQSTTINVPERPAYRKHMRYGLLAALALLILFGGLGFHLRRPAVAQADEVLLGAFTNSTGDATFDETLRNGLAVKLTESPFLNVVPEEKVRSTLALMKRNPNEVLSPEIAKEVCERESIKVMVNSDISSLGANYIITLNAQDCRSGKVLARLQLEAKNKEECIRVLGQGASRLRRELGESLKSIAQYDMPLEEATTESIEALHYYSLGRAKQRIGDYETAIALYKQAVALDPEFAMAWRALAQRLRQRSDNKSGNEAIRTAFNLRQRVSEREKNVISAQYYQIATGELYKAEAAHLLNLKIYPRDISSHVLISLLYEDLGRWDEAVAHAKEAIAISPDYLIPKVRLAHAYICINRFNEATETVKGSVENAYPELSYELAFVREDRSTMQKWFEQTRGGPSDLHNAAALVKAFSGQMRDSRAMFQQTRKHAQRNQAQSDDLRAAQALIETEFGNAAEAHTLLAEVKSSSILVALAKARAGDFAGANRINEELSRQWPESTLFQNLWKPTITGALEFQRGRFEAAISNFEIGKGFELGTGGEGNPDAFVRMYLRGYAHLRLGHATEAIADFQRVLDHRGLDPLSPYYVLSYLGLARSYHASGDMGESLNAYEHFLEIWNHADSNLPIYAQAKAEFQALRR